MDRTLSPTSSPEEQDRPAQDPLPELSLPGIPSESSSQLECAAIHNGTIFSSSGAWFAVVAVLAIAWFPYTAVNVLYWIFGSDSSLWTYLANTLWEVVRYISIIVVVLFIMYCDGRPWSTFGITNPRWLMDPLMALGILVVTSGVMTVAYQWVCMVVGEETAYEFSESTYEFAMPLIGSDYFALVLLSLSVGLSEELAMRAYLIPTFERLLKSTPLSVVLTSFLFASYHIYQGFGATAWLFLLGLIFGAFFCWQRRIWPLVIAHAAMDVIALSPRGN